MRSNSCLECGLGMACKVHELGGHENEVSSRRRSERLSMTLIKRVLEIIDHTRKSRQQILDEVQHHDIKATKHQIFKLLDNWVESGEIKKVKTLIDGRRVFYYKDHFEGIDVAAVLN